MRGIRRVQSFLFCVAAATSAACVSTGPSAEPWGGRADTTLALRIGQEVGAPDSVMRISFLGVRADSRCPVDVVCVWQGDAEVEIGVRFGMGPTVPYVLHTGVAPRSVDLGLYRITLVGLRPTPVSTTPIPPDCYVAELRLERIAAPGS
ncbi:MAG: hypothetical protein AAB409_04320 [Gemmatimonadota bacterium]